MQRNQKRASLSWVASLTIVLIGVAIVAVSADDISTGTVAKAEPPIKQDGTLAHPYADATNAHAAPTWLFGLFGRKSGARSRPSPAFSQSVL
jgi:hypothetical protein